MVVIILRVGETPGRGGVNIIEARQGKLVENREADPRQIGEIPGTATGRSHQLSEEVDFIKAVPRLRHQPRTGFQVNRRADGGDRLQPGYRTFRRFPGQLEGYIATQGKTDDRHRRRRRPAAQLGNRRTHIVGTAGMVGPPCQGKPSPGTPKIHPNHPQSSRQEVGSKALKVTGAVRADQAVNQQGNPSAPLPAGGLAIVQDDPIAVGQMKKADTGGSGDGDPAEKIAQHRLHVRIAQQRQRAEIAGWAVGFHDKESIAAALGGACSRGQSRSTLSSSRLISKGLRM